MLPSTIGSSWFDESSLSTNFFSPGFDDFELYEGDDAFVLTIDLPGFDLDEITVSWDEGVLHIGAEHTDEARGRQKTYQRTFRLPKDVAPDDISAQYRNGVLEVTLPITDARVRGTEIPVQG